MYGGGEKVLWLSGYEIKQPASWPAELRCPFLIPARTREERNFFGKELTRMQQLGGRALRARKRIERDLNVKEMAELHGSLREGRGDSGREEEDEDEEEEEEVQEAAEVEEEEEEEEQHRQHGGEMEGEEAAAAEGDEDDEYELRFEGEMDPLRFAEEDETGKLPYEQFQRLEYEALAARKRKALASRRE